jgi:predicted lysophospholipase L1 biosynthesis ABC-type transport system permease subunit
VLGIFYRVVSILRYIVCVSGTYHDNMLNLFSGITSIPISVYIPVIILPITIILLVLLIIYRNSTVWRIIIITLAAALILITKVFSNQYITIIASRINTVKPHIQRCVTLITIPNPYHAYSLVVYAIAITLILAAFMLQIHNMIHNKK